jgi:hypothetical protein
VRTRQNMCLSIKLITVPPPPLNGLRVTSPSASYADFFCAALTFAPRAR